MPPSPTPCLYRMWSMCVIALAFAGPAAAADATQIKDEAAAIAAAKRYTKARCTAQQPCEYKARREGSQWNVMVEVSRRAPKGEVSNKYAGGHLLLYFNPQGQLLRRVEAE